MVMEAPAEFQTSPGLFEGLPAMIELVMATGLPGL